MLLILYHIETNPLERVIVMIFMTFRSSLIEAIMATLCTITSSKFKIVRNTFSGVTLVEISSIITEKIITLAIF